MPKLQQLIGFLETIKIFFASVSTIHKGHNFLEGMNEFHIKGTFEMNEIEKKRIELIHELC